MAQGDPVALARMALADLRPGDVVERGGYAAGAGRVCEGLRLAGELGG